MDPLRKVSAQQRIELARRLRSRPTPMERHAWSLLRNRRVLGLKFRRQHIVHGFIVDFCCLERKLVIELEGSAHEGQQRSQYDRARADLLTAAGYTVIRIRNRDVTRERLEALFERRTT